jgi:RimJ/RimL family protein N-acetyltransferase/predicted HAD superfamily Cof-like phosphohydrolase
MQQVVLRDDVIELSAPTAEDVPAIFAACQDPDVARYTTLPFPYAVEDAVSFVAEAVPETWAHPHGGIWAIRRDGEFGGVVGLHPRGARVSEIGYWTAPSARGQGLVTRAVGLVVEQAFAAGLDRIDWVAAVGNWASWKVAWRHGFTLEGIKRGAIADNSRPGHPLRDGWFGGLLATDPRTPARDWLGPVGTLPARPDPARPLDLVRQFHETYDVPVITTGADLDVPSLGMRMALIAEEFGELVGAVFGDAAEGVVLQGYGDALAFDEERRDTVAAADALADLVYVAYGMALETGIPLDDVLGEVQRSNLSKLDADGSVIRRADGKVLKGPGFRAPDIARVLRERTLG